MSPEQADRLVLMSGGYTPDSGAAGALQHGVVLEKPFELDEVRTLMRETMRRGPLPRAATPTHVRAAECSRSARISATARARRIGRSSPR